jgi:hypothetical protein
LPQTIVTQAQEAMLEQAKVEQEASDFSTDDFF